MKKLLLFASIILMSLLSTAQVVVTSLNIDEGDLKAKVDPKQDRHGQYCALLKISTVGINESARQKFVFEGGDMSSQVVDVSYPTGAIWVYVSPGRPVLKIKHPDFGNITYNAPIELTPKSTYKMTIELESATLIIKSLPSDAEIFINGEKSGIGYASKAVSIGVENRYKIIADYYNSKEGVIVFDKREKKELLIELEPNFGYITVTSEPSGADVYIDNTKAGVTPYSMEKINPGRHNIKVEKDLYQTYTNVIEVKKGETKTINTNLVSNTAELKVTTKDYAEIWVDGEKKGVGNWNGFVAAGNHTVEAKKQGFMTKSQTVLINANSSKTISFTTLEKPMGSLKVVSFPSKAKIKLNVEDKGETPTTLNNLPIGSYKVELSKEKYYKAVRYVTVNEGETTMLEVNMEEIKSLRKKGVVVRLGIGFGIGPEPKYPGTELSYTMFTSTDNKYQNAQQSNRYYLVYDDNTQIQTTLTLDVGYFFGPQFYLGLGCGLDTYFTSIASIPMYINPRYYFQNKKKSYYCDLKLGITSFSPIKSNLKYDNYSNTTYYSYNGNEFVQVMDIFDPYTDFITIKKDYKLNPFLCAIEIGKENKHSNYGFVFCFTRLSTNLIADNHYYYYLDDNLHEPTEKPQGYNDERVSCKVKDMFFSFMFKYSFNIFCYKTPK